MQPIYIQLGIVAMFRFNIHLCQVVGALSHWDSARPQGPYPSSGPHHCSEFLMYSCDELEEFDMVHLLGVFLSYFYKFDDECVSLELNL